MEKCLGRDRRPHQQCRNPGPRAAARIFPWRRNYIRSHLDGAVTSNGNADSRLSGMRIPDHAGAAVHGPLAPLIQSGVLKETMSMSYNYLLACWGDGPGNLAPVLTAARRLRHRGHEVRVLADRELRQEVEAAGFPFASWRRPPKFSDVGVDLSDLRVLFDRLLFASGAAYADDTREELARTPPDALLAHSMLLGAAVAAEAAGVPCAMLSPHISLRPLPGLPPVGSGLMPSTTGCQGAAFPPRRAPAARRHRSRSRIRHAGHGNGNDRRVRARGSGLDAPARGLKAAGHHGRSRRHRADTPALLCGRVGGRPCPTTVQDPPARWRSLIPAQLR